MNKDRKSVWLISFGYTLTAYFVFLAFRGSFGWDGDTIDSINNFIRLINPKLFGIAPDSIPKIGMTLFLGPIYVISGHLEATTLFSIALNAIAVATIVLWVKDSGGVWWIGLVLLLFNTYWAHMVVSSDSPAFSVPLSIIGLWFYISKNRKQHGLLFLVLSSLFRPGAEVIIACLILIEIYRRNFKAVFVAIIPLAIGVLSTLFGYRIGFKTHAEYYSRFLDASNGGFTGSLDYQYSYWFWLPYLKSLLSMLKFHVLKPYFLLIPFAIFGYLKLWRTTETISLFVVLIASNAIMLMNTFLNGVTAFDVAYHMEWPIIISVYTSFAFKEGPHGLQILRFKTWPIILVCLLLFIGIQGTRTAGTYEIKKDGSGRFNWKSLREDFKRIGITDVKSIATTKDNLYFVFLEYGLDIDRVLILSDSSSEKDLDGIDVVLISPDSPLAKNLEKQVDFLSIPVDLIRTVFVKRKN